MEQNRDRKAETRELWLKLLLQVVQLLKLLLDSLVKLI